jgi:Ser/Thr protein kinase RdoA (MazF antagonist)
MKSVTIPESIFAAFPFGEITSVKPISIGLIHQAYQIRASNGMFILQRLHAVLASDAIGKDFLAVTRHLEAEGFPAARCVLSTKGKVLVKDEEGYKWRAQTFLKGKTYHRVESAAMAREAGAVFARFHHTMAHSDYVFKSTKILHETEKIFETFTQVVKKNWDSPLMKDVANEVVFLSKEINKVLLPSDLPLRAIHGDPKISNLLFDAKGHATAIVDLDTCNRRPLLVETGDAFRSWCGGREDDPKNTFRLEIFKAGWKGYAAGAGDFITSRERKLVPKSVATITLELTARFLTDYFNDNYFGWDASRYASRRAHNLARVRGQLALYRDIWKKMDKMKAIVG